jgi:hypothetical protein
MIFVNFVKRRVIERKIASSVSGLPLKRSQRMAMAIMIKIHLILILVLLLKRVVLQLSLNIIGNKVANALVHFAVSRTLLPQFNTRSLPIYGYSIPAAIHMSPVLRNAFMTIVSFQRRNLLLDLEEWRLRRKGKDVEF